MRLIVVAVYDSVVRAYNQPMFFRSKAEAIRSFQDACNAEASQFKKHAADYHIAMLGHFDDASGGFELPAAPERLISASECVSDDVQPPRMQ